MSNSAFLVAPRRTTIGLRNAALASWHPIELAALSASATLASLKALPDIDQVVMGVASQTGEQSSNVARQVALASEFPEATGGFTIEAHAGSSHRALQAAVAAVASSQANTILCGGVESMSRVPAGAAVTASPGLPYGPTLHARYADRGGLIPQSIAAQQLSDELGIDRKAMDEFAVRSHERAAGSARSLAPYRVDVAANSADEAVLPAADIAGFAEAVPLFEREGTVTALNSARMADGAATALIGNDALLDQVPAGGFAFRIVACAQTAGDPLRPFAAADGAVRRAVAVAGVEISAIDLAEIHEPFAVASLGLIRTLGLEPERCNVFGGSIAYGEPLGAVGAMQFVHLAAAMQDAGAQLGVVVTFEALGGAVATLIAPAG